MPAKEGLNQIRLDEAVLNFNGLTVTKGRDILQPKNSYNITAQGQSNVRFGSSNPVALLTDKENDTYIWSTNGLATGQALRTYTFDATSNLWVLISGRTNVSFGSTVPTGLLTDNENDTYIRTSDGTPTGTIIGTYVYDQTSNAWYLQASTSLNKIRIVQALVAGNNIIPFGTTISSSPVTVEVRNNTSGAIIAHRVITETATNVTINVAVAVASARITIIG